MPFNVSFIIRLQDRFSKNARNINTQLKAMSDNARRTSEGFRDVGRALTTRLTLPIAAFGAIGIRTTFNFQKQMNAVAAVTEATGEEFQALTVLAKELGRTTQFTAREAAAGMAFLGQTGFNANEIMATLPQTLNLAAAGGLDLASAADIASNILKGFNAEVSEAGRFVDILAVTAAKSNTNIFQLGQAMKFVAPVAAATGVTMAETAAAMGILGDAGIQGSLAGTGMKTIFKKLITESDKLAPALKGVSLETDGFTAVIEKLAEAGLTTAGAFEIFEARGAPAILALVAQVQRLKELNVAIDGSAGAAERMAKIRMGGIVGSFLLLKSATEGVFLAFFGAPEVSKFIENLTTSLARLANRISNLSPRVRVMILIFLAFVALIGPIILMLGLFAVAIAALSVPIAAVGVAFTATFGAMAVSFLGGAAAITAITLGVTALGVVLGKFFAETAIDALINKFSILGKEIRSLNKELGLNIEPTIAKGLRGFDIPKGLNEETKQLLLLNAAIAETKLQISQGIAKGINVGELKTSLQTLEAAKPAVQQTAKIDINVRAERGTQAFTRVEGNIPANTGQNMVGAAP